MAQDFEQLVSKKKIDCSDISYNCSNLFIRYYHEEKLDSARNLIKYWESKCGMLEPLFRAKLILSLKEGNFHDSLIHNGILNYITSYQNRVNMIKYSNFYHYDTYKYFYGYIPPGQEFDTFSLKTITKLKTIYNSQSLEYLLGEFYSNNCDTIFYKLQTKIYKTTMLGKEYNFEVDKYKNLSELHYSVITGIWIPTGELKKIGLHPEIGFQIGSKRKKMNYDLGIAFKFLSSPNDYYAKRPDTDSLIKTNHFFGGYIGLDVGRDVYARMGREIQILGGFAFDGFDILPQSKDKSVKSASAVSYNINFGIGYRYYFTNSFYLGLRAKYNIVNYTLNNVIDFTGNPITIQFIVGGLSNPIKYNNLKDLNYKLRR